MSQFAIGLMVVGFVIVSVMMMLVVLIQRPTGGGLSGAFGSSSEGAGQTAFGARTGDALTTATIVIFLLFLGFAIGLNYVVEGPKAGPAAQAVPADLGPGDEQAPLGESTPAPPGEDAGQDQAPAQTPTNDQPPASPGTDAGGGQ